MQIPILNAQFSECFNQEGDSLLSPFMGNDFLINNTQPN